MARAVARFPDAGDYLTFVEEFLLKNEPCLFPAAVTRDWRARREWQKNGKPNLDYLAAEFGDARVPVADCSKQHFDSHSKTEMKMRDYLDYWRAHMTREEGGGRVDSQLRAHGEEESTLLYLKDWHFFKQYPDYGAYTVLPYFAADWLNEVWDQRDDVRDDYRFIYFGPTGTWTPFHADVFRSYSWSANVCGKKEWLLLPPGEENRLRDDCGRLPFDLRTSDPRLQCDTLIRVVQEEGEIIFVPSGWYHQVHNVEDAISINHNWVNGFGVFRMWRHLHSELQLVKREITDCRDMTGWDTHCQVILRACVGLDYLELLQMLCLLALPRLKELHSLISTTASPPSLTSLGGIVARVTSCSELTRFGHRRQAVEGGEAVISVAGGEDVTSVAGREGVAVVAGGEGVTSVAGGEGVAVVAGGEAVAVVAGGEAVAVVAGGEGVTVVAGGEAVTSVAGGEGVAVVDGLREVLRDCDLRAGSSHVQSVWECLSEEEKRLLAGVCDVPMKTLCTLRLFELSQISRILAELVTDSDMQTIAPLDILQS